MIGTDGAFSINYSSPHSLTYNYHSAAGLDRFGRVVDQHRQLLSRP
jgi:hypothetical protein